MEILFVLLILAIVVAWFMWSARILARRRKDLLEKYGDPDIVERIMRRTYWQGQTQDQLLDSLGRPVDIDTEADKTETKETWKYQRTGKNRFHLRVLLENSIVVGWEQE